MRHILAVRDHPRVGARASRHLRGGEFPSLLAHPSSPVVRESVERSTHDRPALAGSAAIRGTAALRIRGRRLCMPVSRRRMFESPVDRDPPRPPRFPFNLFRAPHMPAQIKAVEVLPRDHVPVAI